MLNWFNFDNFLSKNVSPDGNVSQSENVSIPPYCILLKINREND